MINHSNKKTVKTRSYNRRSESGAGRLKFLLVVAVLVCGGYVLYQFIPVAYQAWLFKDLMQHEVDVAAAAGYDNTWVKKQLAQSENEYSVPTDAVIETAPIKVGGQIEVTVRFTRPIPLPGYVYQYQFDHTAKSTQFIIAK